MKNSCSSNTRLCHLPKGHNKQSCYLSYAHIERHLPGALLEIYSPEMSMNFFFPQHLDSTQGFLLSLAIGGIRAHSYNLQRGIESSRGHHEPKSFWSLHKRCY